MASTNTLALLQAQLARFPQLDPRTVEAIASGEGLSGGIGDNGTSFGPFQLHIGGAYPSWAPQGNPQASQAWAWSPQGLDYALQQLQGTIGGAKGAQGITLGVNNFERPAAQYRSGEISNDLSAYGGSGGIAGRTPTWSALTSYTGGSPTGNTTSTPVGTQGGRTTSTPGVNPDQSAYLQQLMHIMQLQGVQSAGRSNAANALQNAIQLAGLLANSGGDVTGGMPTYNPGNFPPSITGVNPGGTTNPGGSVPEGTIPAPNPAGPSVPGLLQPPYPGPGSGSGGPGTSILNKSRGLLPGLMVSTPGGNPIGLSIAGLLGGKTQPGLTGVSGGPPSPFFMGG